MISVISYTGSICHCGIQKRFKERSAPIVVMVDGLLIGEYIVRSGPIMVNLEPLGETEELEVIEPVLSIRVLVI